MEVPKRLTVDMIGSRNALPGGYSSSEEDDFGDDDSYQYTEPIIKLQTPPKKLTATHISEEERNRFLRDTSIGGANLDDSTYKTPNDTILKNMTSFHSGDSVSLPRQVKHLHNRVKLLEEELQTQHNRQVFLFGVISVYLLSRGFKWMFR